MRSRRLGFGTLVVAATALAVVWVTRGSIAGPPIYDGLPLSSEPYRYLQPSPGQATTAPPTSASDNVRTPATSPILVNTAESPPQAELQADPDAFDAPASVPNLTVTITPVLPAAAVTKGRLDGNVYRMLVTGPDGNQVRVRPGKHVTVLLRGTGATGKPTIDLLSLGRWAPLRTIVPGPGFHSADSGALGDFALVILPGSGGTGEGVTAAIVVGAVLVALPAFLVAVRLFRGQH